MKHETARSPSRCCQGLFKALVEALHRLQSGKGFFVRIQDALGHRRSALAHERAVRNAHGNW